MLYFDATHTSHTRAQTGIQRVCRSLFAELDQTRQVTAICHDPYLHAWRPLGAIELGQLHQAGRPGGSRRSLWSQRQRLLGHGQRLLGLRPELPVATGLICPEFFSGKVGARLPEVFARVSGPRIALFYDAIPLQFPELTPPGTVARFPAYLRELLQFDGVAAISETSATILREYWQWLDVAQSPPVVAIPLAVGPRPAKPTDLPGPALPRLLCVGTIEGRKNHLALLEACDVLWREGQQFELQLVGLARPDTAGPALEKIAALQRAGRPLLFAGVATDAEIESAYRGCSFTVYPSLVEGFGLPVQESLGFGKPCICSARGALGESARGGPSARDRLGGCVTLESVDPASLAVAIRRLLQDPRELGALAAAARARTFKTWADYCRELTAWMQSLPGR